MTVTGGARRGRRALAFSLFGTLIAAALVLGHGPGVTQAAEAAGKQAAEATAAAAKAKPAKAASAKKKVGTSKTKPKATAKKKKSTTVAKTKHPLPPPRKPTALAAAASAAPPAAAETPKTDVAASLDKGVAEVMPTASRPAEIKVKPAESAPVAESAPAEPKVAATPPEPAVTLTKESLRIHFSAGASDLPEVAEQSIGELAALMSREPSLRLQLLAFAAGTKETASQSRRLSLNRALAVRGALIDAGVRSTRIDVRALGNQTEESPPDRVDVLVMQRGGG